MSMTCQTSGPPTSAARRPAGTRGVAHAAPPEPIAAVINGLAASLFGRHVLRSTGDNSGSRQAGIVGGSSQTEVRDLNSLDAF